MPDEFHFIRPWVLALIPIILLLVFLWMRAKLSSSQWQSIIPAHLHTFLIKGKGDKKSKGPFIWLALVLVIACVAGAGPAWERLPQPVYQTQSGKVLVMDMSLSMRATDLNPNRLARAKFKAIDLINEINDGEVGLVAYSADAFTISPLTEDISNLENLIPSLSPEIMPGSGSNPLSALNLAQELLNGAGYQSGHIYWLTDGINYRDIAPIRELLNTSKHQFSVLSIGTEEGAPIKLTDGSLLKDGSGAIVIPQLNQNYLKQALATSNARHTAMTIDSRDIESMLLRSNRLDQIKEQENQQSTGDQFADMGVYLVVLLLPLSAFFFRKGLLFTIVSVSVLSLQFITSTPAYAQAPSEQQAAMQASQQNTEDGILNKVENAVRSAFLNRDQKGKAAFENQNYEKASELFEDKNWQAAAAYKSGDFEKALSLYQQGDDAQSLYNQGNAHAQLGQLDDAITAYEKALQLQEDFEDAARNKAIIEALKDQQEQNQNEQNQQNQDNQDDGQNDQESSQNQENQQGQNQDQQGTSGENESSEDQQSKEEQQQNEQGAGEQDNSEQAQNQESNPAEPETQNADDTQNQSEEQTEQAQPEPFGQGEESEQTPSESQDPESVQAIKQSELSPQEREEMQRLQTLMNKVPDDPAFLLQRKMMIEAQKRRQYGPPQTQEQEW